MKLKGLHFVEIQETVTNELKKGQKDEFLAAFQILYDHAESCIYANERTLNKRKSVSSSCQLATSIEMTNEYGCNM